MESVSRRCWLSGCSREDGVGNQAHDDSEASRIFLLDVYTGIVIEGVSALSAECRHARAAVRRRASAAATSIFACRRTLISRPAAASIASACNIALSC